MYPRLGPNYTVQLEVSRTGNQLIRSIIWTIGLQIQKPFRSVEWCFYSYAIHLRPNWLMILASDGVNNNSWYQILPTNGVYMVVEEKLWKSHKTALIINLPFFLKSFKIMSLPFPNVDIASNKKVLNQIMLAFLQANVRFTLVRKMKRIMDMPSLWIPVVFIESSWRTTCLTLHP